MASTPGSITQWIDQLKAGEDTAAQEIWQRYWTRLVSLARGKLRPSRRREADEEDVALSAFDSFCRGAGAGRFPLLRDRNNLWSLLIVITARKAADQIDREFRQKRGGALVRGESALVDKNQGGGDSLRGLDRVAGREPTAQFAAQVAEECERLLDKLDNNILRSIALSKMEGYTNAEIASKLGCVEGTVERKLRLIRGLWQEDGSQDA
jgi:DNA-directed RNA polymerase specialized sigma24 family protein